MKSQRLSPSFVQHLFRFLLPVLFLAAPFAGFAAPTITATKDDGVATGVRKVSGSTINYTNTISNTAAPGPGNDATGVTFTDPNVLHTTVAAGSLNVTPVALDDTYPGTVLANTSINTATSTGFSVVTNDFTGFAADVAVPISSARIGCRVMGSSFPTRDSSEPRPSGSD